MLLFERIDPMSCRGIRNLNPFSHLRLLSYLTIAAAVLVFAGTDIAQNRRLKRSDLIQLNREILRTNDFNETETCCDKDKTNIVYVVDADLSPSQLPVRKYVKFELITKKDAKTRFPDGIELYSFGPPTIGRSSVRIDLYLESKGADGGNGSTVVYTGRRASKGWKVKGRLGDAWCSASGFAIVSPPN